MINHHDSGLDFDVALVSFLAQSRSIAPVPDKAATVFIDMWVVYLFDDLVIRNHTL